MKNPAAVARYLYPVFFTEERRLPFDLERGGFKSRDLSALSEKALSAQMIEDAGEALRKYGETLDIRRDSLQSLLRQGREVSVSRVRLIYERASLMPKDVDELEIAVNATRAKVSGVDVLFQ